MATDSLDKPALLNGSTIPSNWSFKPLAHFVDRVTYGFTNPMPSTDEGPFLITAKDIHGGRIDYSTARHTSWDAFRNRITDKSRPRVNDVLLTKDGSIGRLALCDKESICINQSVAVLRPNRRILPRFLKFLLEAPYYQKRMEADSDGSTIKHIYITRVDKMEVSIPPLAEQLEIMNVLGALEDRMELHRKINGTLESTAQAIFKSWFVDFDPVKAKAEGREPEGMDAITAALFPNDFEMSNDTMIPLGWSRVTLGSVCTRITKGTTPTTLKRPFVQSGINFIKAESLTDNGELLPKKFSFIDDETDGLLKRSRLEVGDVLVTIAGTIGRTAMVPLRVLPANTNQAVAIVRANPDVVPPACVYQYLRFPAAQTRLTQQTVQAVQANVSLGTLSALEIVLPPADILAELCNGSLIPIRVKIEHNAAMARTLSELRDVLLPKLIAGQIRVPEAEALVSA
jgi:type I restriction enzyme S subunit